MTTVSNHAIRRYGERFLGKAWSVAEAERERDEIEERILAKFQNGELVKHNKAGVEVRRCKGVFTMYDFSTDTILSIWNKSNVEHWEQSDSIWMKVWSDREWSRA